MDSCWVVYKEAFDEFDTVEKALAVFSRRDTAEQQILAYEGDGVSELPFDVVRQINLPEGNSIFRVFRMSNRFCQPIHAAKRLGCDEIDWKIYRRAQGDYALDIGWHSAEGSPEIPLPPDATKATPYRVYSCYVLAVDEKSAIDTATRINGKRSVLQREVVEYSW
jgi:hypothetical protein